MRRRVEPRAPATGRYLTDGVNLYRLVAIDDLRDAEGFVEIEDCHSLARMVVPAEELRSWHLRRILVG